MQRLAFHWKIIIGIFLGVLVGAFLTQFPSGPKFAINWIKPWGTVFMNLLKLMSVPLILTSLIKGITDLKNVKNFSKIGGKTFIWYGITTVIAISLGLLLVNTIRPGLFISSETRSSIMEEYKVSSGEEVALANNVADKGPLQPLVDIVPDNFFFAASSNENMLQLILFAALFGFALLLVPNENTKVVKQFVDGSYDVIIGIVGLIMKITPIGVFALLTALVVEAPSSDIFVALAMYGLTVILGLAILLFVIYPTIVWLVARMKPMFFLKGMSAAQLVAFSTSSAAATLPVTMDCINNKLHVNKDISSFVVPIGATINMDGTTLYQAIAAVFIAQVTGHHLDFAAQLRLVFTAALAGFGAAAVPSGGILMLIIVLQSMGVNPAAIALIFAVDRPIDMCRTVVNVTGDGMVAVVIEKSVKL
jgi:proton glutamate symport protein